MHHDNWATFLNEKPLDNIGRQIKFYLSQDVSMNGKTIYIYEKDHSFTTGFLQWFNTTMMEGEGHKCMAFERKTLCQWEEGIL
jgi:hypothetical protein